MPFKWGPHFIIPTQSINTYSGHVKLRETLDRNLLVKELEELELPTHVVKISNPWYLKKQGTETWIKLGESIDEKKNFPVDWDTTQYENGQYVILGLMHVYYKHNGQEGAIVRQSATEVTVQN